MNIGTLMVSLVADTSGLSAAEVKVTGLGRMLMGLGGIMAAAFSVGKIIAFSKESMNLAANMEGVHTAFNRIGQSSKVFDELKVATRGATDNFKLMQMAVKATDAGIATKDLITYLNFASARAITLGKSVDEFSDIIVKGAIRKFARSMAPMALSVKEVTAAFKTNSFPQYIEAQTKKMGEVTDTMQIKLARYTTSVTNLKLAYGDWLIKSDLVSGAVTGLTHRMEILGDTSLTAWQKFWMGWAAYSKYKTEQTAKEDEMRKQLAGLSLEDLIGLQKAATHQYIPDPTYIKVLNEMIAAMKAAKEPIKAVIETLETLKQKLVDEQVILSHIPEANRGEIESENKVIEALKRRIEAIEKLTNVYKVFLDQYEAHIKATTAGMKEPSAVTNLNEQQPIDYRKFFMKMQGATGFGISQGIQDVNNQLALVDIQAKILGNTFDKNAAITQVYTTELDKLWEEGLRPGNAEIDDLIKKLEDLNQNMYQNTMIDKLTHGLIKQSEVVRSLQSAFEQLFSKTGGGFKAMVNSIITGIERIIAKLMAEIAVWLILDAISGGTGIIAGQSIGTLKSFLGLTKLAGGGTIPPGYPNDTYPALLSSGETVSPPGQLSIGNKKIQIELTGNFGISGKDAVLMLRRQIELS